MNAPQGYTPVISFFEKNYLPFLRRGQKLVVKLENEVVQNLKLEKNMFIQKSSPKLIFFNEKKIH